MITEIKKDALGNISWIEGGVSYSYTPESDMAKNVIDRAEKEGLTVSEYEPPSADIGSN